MGMIESVTATLLPSDLTTTPCMENPEAWHSPRSLVAFHQAREQCLRCPALAACERYADSLGPVWTSTVVAARLVGWPVGPGAWSEGSETWVGRQDIEPERSRVSAEVPRLVDRAYCVAPERHEQPSRMGLLANGARCYACRASIRHLDRIVPLDPMPDVIWIVPGRPGFSRWEVLAARVSWEYWD